MAEHLINDDTAIVCALGTGETTTGNAYPAQVGQRVGTNKRGATLEIIVHRKKKMDNELKTCSGVPRHRIQVTLSYMDHCCS